MTPLHLMSRKSGEYGQTQFFIPVMDGKSIPANNLSDKEILRLASVNANHRGDTLFSLKSVSLRESWASFGISEPPEGSFMRRHLAFLSRSTLSFR